LAISPDFGPLSGIFLPGGSETLVVMVHGDISKSGDSPEYMKTAAMLIRDARPKTSVAIIFRPGYCDAQGQNCSGKSGEYGGNPDPGEKWDFYTPENIKLLRQSIESLKASVRAQNVLGVTHSGGAAMLAVVLGDKSDLIDKAILVACPCDVRAWKPRWKESENPVDYVDSIPPEVPIVLIHGTDDRMVNKKHALDYAEAVLKVRNRRTGCVRAMGTKCGVKMVLLPGHGHSFNRMRCEILDEVALLLPGKPIACNP
jgi:hypothetical protein